MHEIDAHPSLIWETKYGPNIYEGPKNEIIYIFLNIKEAEEPTPGAEARGQVMFPACRSSAHGHVSKPVVRSCPVLPKLGSSYVPCRSSGQVAPLLPFFFPSFFFLSLVFSSFFFSPCFLPFISPYFPSPLPPTPCLGAYQRLLCPPWPLTPLMY